MCVLHKCDVPSCVNPDHLFLGTNRDNIDDMVRKRRTTHGERNPGAKLRAHQVQEIRSEYATGKFSQRQLARKYGVWQGTIWQIIAGKHWRDIPNAETGNDAL